MLTFAKRTLTEFVVFLTKTKTFNACIYLLLLGSKIKRTTSRIMTSAQRVYRFISEARHISVENYTKDKHCFISLAHLWSILLILAFNAYEIFDIIRLNMALFT